MPLRPPKIIPKTLRDWSEWCGNTTVAPGDGTVTESMIADDAVSNRALRNSSPFSVIGNPTATGASPSDIAAGANDTFMARRSGALQFVTLLEGDIPATIARDTEVAAAVAAAITAHEGAADPHSVYLTQTEGDARYRELTDAVTYAELTGKPAALALIFSGTGTPEGAVVAGVGSTFHRTDGGAGTSFYVKESGAGNTGWVGK